ncbi:MAG: HNH endonuclease signature motif containing protein [bacterium]|nr:HNH endonuclease signature motif containing protein [bacterium]
MLHRAIWTDAHGPIPDGHHIHHIDGNPTNNDLANLECLPAGAHIAKHARNRPPHTAEAKARIGDANRKHWAERKPRDITCAVCGTVFQSTGTRAKFCSTSCATKDRHRRTYVPGKGYRRRDGTYSPRP